MRCPRGARKWDNDNKAYVAKGAIAVSSIMDRQVNSTPEGYLIIEKGQNSDVITIYLQTELYDEYYFLGYSHHYIF